MFLLVFLVLLLSVVNAAWIIYYKKTITTNVIGEETVYTISQEFANTLSLNTTSGPANITTLMEIKNLNENIKMSFEIETRKTNLTNASCPNYRDDCGVIVTHIYDSIRRILSNRSTTITDKENFTLFTPLTNFIEYRIECVEDSCSQRINSNITLEEIK